MGYETVRYKSRYSADISVLGRDNKHLVGNEEMRREMLVISEFEAGLECKEERTKMKNASVHKVFHSCL